LPVANQSEGLDQMPPRPVSIDHRLAKALSNPLRAQALHLIADGIASPKAIAEKLGLDVRGVAYHVRVLDKLGCIELAETHQRRGVLEHVYRVTERAIAKD
jgi:DNA-binding transcriptional ArsR family regulator